MCRWALTHTYTRRHLPQHTHAHAQILVSFLLLFRPSDSLYILRMYVCGAMCECICIFESICVSALIALTPTSVKWESPSICLKEQGWESTVDETKWWIMQTSTQMTLLTLIGTVQVKYSSHCGTKSMTNCSCYALHLIECSARCDLAGNYCQRIQFGGASFPWAHFQILKPLIHWFLAIDARKDLYILGFVLQRRNFWIICTKPCWALINLNKWEENLLHILTSVLAGDQWDYFIKPCTCCLSIACSGSVGMVTVKTARDEKPPGKKQTLKTDVFVPVW